MRFDAPDARLFNHAVLPRAELDAMLVEYRRLADEHGPQSAPALRVRNRIIAANMRLVAHVAKRYRAPRGMDLQDLHAYGVLGLIKAIERFDATRGFAFVTYAPYWIRHSIGRSLADLADVIRIPVHAQANASRSEETARKVHAVRCAGWLDAKVGGPDADGGTFGDVTPDDRALRSYAAPEDEQVAALVRAAIERLPERLRDVVRARMDDEETLAAVGESMGLSRERIRQLELEAFAALRAALRELRDVAAA